MASTLARVATSRGLPDQGRPAERGDGPGTRWRLDAAHAESFEKQRTVLKQVTIQIEEPREPRAWTVTGDEGELQQPSRDVELRGNVVLVSSEGFRLETSRLLWDGERAAGVDGRAGNHHAMGPVVRGQGLESRVAEAPPSRAACARCSTRQARRRAPARRRRAPEDGRMTR